MNKKQRSKYNMCIKTEAYVDTVEIAILSTMPMFQTWFSLFKIILQQIAHYLQTQDKILAGYLENKAKTREELTALTTNLAAILQSYADAIDDVVLYHNMNIKKSYLNRLPAVDLIAISKNVIEKATSILPSLLPYNVTPLSIAQNTAFIETYKKAIADPDKAALTKEEATSEIKEKLSQAKKILNKIDGAVNTNLQDHLLFANNYFTARKTTKLPTIMLSARGLITDAQGTPMPFVRISCKTLKLNRKTTKSGTFFIKNGIPGLHTLTASFPGYKDSHQTITIHNVSVPNCK